MVAAEDTFITEHEGFGGVTGQHGAATYLAVIGTGVNPYLTYSLIKFDLGAHAGREVTGDAVFKIHVEDAASPGVARTLSVYQILVGWSGATVTWNNFGGDPGLQTGVDIWEQAHDSVSFTPSASPLSEVVEFTIPRALIQEWIDTPGSNHGLLLAVGGVGRDVYFTSSEAADEVPKPTLEFPSVPRPSTLAMLSSQVDPSTGSATFTWSSTEGKTYRIAGSTDLAAWDLTLAEGVEATSASTTRTVSFTPGTRMFFRIEEEIE